MRFLARKDKRDGGSNAQTYIAIESLDESRPQGREGRLFDLTFRVMDTAGFEDQDPQSLPGRMRMQTEAAVREADVALFLIDAREGLTPLDEEIARWLRSHSTPVVVAANKAEGRAGEAGILEAYALGLGEPRVVHVDQEAGYRITVLAPDFAGFVRALRPESDYDDS